MAKFIRSYWLRENGQEGPIEVEETDLGLFVNIGDRAQFVINGKRETLIVLAVSVKASNLNSPDSEDIQTIILGRTVE
jgi:hypothetical protein